MREIYLPEVVGKVQWWNQAPGGIRTALGENHNVVTYLACDIFAKLLGGDVSHVPSHIGFLFGAVNYQNDFLSSYPRLQDWNDIAQSINGKESNILLAPISFTSFSVDRSRYLDANYTGNVLKITSNTSSSGILALSGSGYKSSLEPGDKFYDVLLISRRQDAGGVYRYVPVARASLKKGSEYPDQLPGLSFGVDWSITFY